MEHKQINGGELWLPFARGRVKLLLAIGLPYASQSYIMPDGAMVRVRIQPGHEFIELTGAPVSGYQFFTTGPVRYRGESLGGNLRNYLGFGLRVGLGKPNSESPELSYPLVAKPFASSVERDEQEPARWKFAAGQDALDFGKYFPVKGSWQIQAHNAHAYFPKDRSGSFSSGTSPHPVLRSSWSSASPISSLTETSGVRRPVVSQIDVIYDIAPALLKKGKSWPVGKYGTAPDADWYRRAAVRRVTHPDFGARTFVVMTDISNTFHAFPVSNSDDSLLQGAQEQWPDQLIKTNIRPENTKSLPAPLPAWSRAAKTKSREFFKDTPDFFGHVPALLQKVPQYRWAFNSECTRACSVVFELIPGLPCDPPNEAHTPMRLVARGTEDEHEVEITEALPGLVELKINLALTGPELDQFSFSLELGTVLRPTIDKRFIMAADYAWNVPQEPETPGGDPAPNFANLDDLMLMVGEIYHQSDERDAPVQTPPRNDRIRDLHCCKALAVIRNHTQDKTVRTFVTSNTDLLYETRLDPEVGYTHFPGSTAFRATGSILSYDLRVLAFAIQKRLVETTPETRTNFKNVRDRVLFWRFGGGTSRAVMQLEVYHHNKLQEAKVMDPDSPLNAKLVAAFSDTGTLGLFKYPVDDIGHHTADTYPLNAYDRLFLTSFLDGASSVEGSLSYPESLYASWSGAQGFVGKAQFNAGPYFYAACMAPALRVSDRASFCVHPDGRWSVATLPSFYYGGTSRHEQAHEDFDPALMRQDYIDIIHLPYIDKESGERKFKRFTHLEAFNQAFGKSLSRSDYLYTFSVVRIVKVDPATFQENLNSYLVVKSTSPDAVDEFLIASKANSPDAERYFPIPEPPCEIDAFTCEFNYQGLRNNHWLLRGATLFY